LALIPESLLHTLHFRIKPWVEYGGSRNNP
jgi:hypothetical protein